MAQHRFVFFWWDWNFWSIFFFKSLSHVRLFATPWTVAYQAPPTIGFSRQEYWSGLPFPSPGDLPNPGIKLRSPALEADALTSEPPIWTYLKWLRGWLCECWYLPKLIKIQREMYILFYIAYTSINR